MRRWRKAGEWTGYASCGGDSRFLTPPERLSSDETDQVQYICHTCPVRPECLKSTLQNNSSGVWTCSTWIPEVKLEMSRKEANKTLEDAEKIRHHLATTYESELERRGEF